MLFVDFQYCKSFHTVLMLCDTSLLLISFTLIQCDIHSKCLSTSVLCRKPIQMLVMLWYLIYMDTTMVFSVTSVCIQVYFSVMLVRVVHVRKHGMRWWGRTNKTTQWTNKMSITAIFKTYITKLRFIRVKIKHHRIRNYMVWFRFNVLFYYFYFLLFVEVVEAPHLYCIETVDSIKLASAINSAVKKTGSEQKLKVYVQVNTSEEESK